MKNQKMYQLKLVVLFVFYCNFILGQNIKNINWNLGTYYGEVNDYDIPNGKGIYKLKENGYDKTIDGNFSNGVLNGKTKTSVFKSNILELESFVIYKDGEPDGGNTLIKYYNEGKIINEIFYENYNFSTFTKTKGYLKEFDDKTIIKLELTGDLIGNQLNGQGRKKFYRNGILYEENKGYYIDNLLNGNCEFNYYSDSGKITESSKGKCKNDLLNGNAELRTFYENGDLNFETFGEMSNHELIKGTTKKYKDGKVILFEDGYYNHNKVLHGKGRMITYGDEITKEFSGDFVNGKPEGIVKIYLNDKISYEGGYHNGELEGEGIIYNNDENYYVKGTFLKSNLLGKYTIEKQGISQNKKGNMNVVKKGYRPENDHYEDELRRITDSLGKELENQMEESLSGKWVKNPKSCKICHGTGIRKTCDMCTGKGKVYCPSCNGKKITSSGRVCINCEGKGIMICGTCHGRGKNIKCDHRLL